MSWLIWKDYRLNRSVVIAAVVLLILPHVVAIIRSLPWFGVDTSVPWTKLLATFLVFSSVFGLGILQLTLAFLGGNAIACERMDRSAEFLACLPISRGRILVSKLTVALGLIAMVWLPNLAILGGIAWSRPLLPDVAEGLSRILQGIAATGLTFFCVAWLFSSMLGSPSFAVCMGLFAPLVPLLVAFLVYLQGWTELLWWYEHLCLALSVISFPSGTLYFLCRTEE